MIAASQPFVLGFDLGGTHLRSVLASRDGTFVERGDEAIDAAAGAEAIVRQVVVAGQKLVHGQPAARLVSAAVASPGLVDVRRRVVLGARNLAGWLDVPLGEMVEAGLGAPVTVGNDVNLAALGEARSGAGRGLDSLAFVSVGTGVGVGLVLDGRVWTGAHFGAGEMNAAPSGYRDEATGREAGVEDVASGPAIVRRAVAAGLRGEGLTTAGVFDAAASGDARARRVIDEAVSALARAIVSLILVVDPAVVVIGGGVSRQGERLLGPLRGAVGSRVRLRTPIEPSALGVDAQLHGAVWEALRLVP